MKCSSRQLQMCERGAVTPDVRDGRAALISLTVQSSGRQLKVLKQCANNFFSGDVIPGRYGPLANKAKFLFFAKFQNLTMKLFAAQKAMTVSERAQLASYEVAETIALKSKSHVLAETVIRPACQKMLKLCSVIKLNKNEQKSSFKQYYSETNY